MEITLERKKENKPILDTIAISQTCDNLWLSSNVKFQFNKLFTCPA